MGATVSNQQYLVKHHNTWVVVVDVPKKLREAAGNSRLRKSLQTSNLNEANRLKLPVVAEFKRQLAELAKAMEDPVAAIMREADINRASLLAPDTVDRTRDEAHRQDFSDREALMDLIREQAAELAELKGNELASQFYKRSTDTGTFLKDHYETFVSETDATGQTKSQHTASIKLLLKWTGENVTVEEIDRKKAGEYVSHLLASSGLARATIKRHLSSLSQLWEWLRSKALGTDTDKVNPWQGHKLGKKSKKKTRVALSDEQLITLLQGSYSTPQYAQLLSDLTCIALLGGPRLDELCAMKAKDVTKREDGYWLSITGGKTDAAVRDVPLHDLATPIIERRLKDKNEYLFKGLTPGGPDKKRMWYVSKAYGRYRGQVGVKGRWLDFHALRHTFTTMMEGNEVPESTAALVVGHARESMTYGRYSKGQRVKLRGTIDQVDYGPKVMTAIKQAVETPRAPKRASAS